MDSQSQLHRESQTGLVALRVLQLETWALQYALEACWLRNRCGASIMLT